MNRLPQFQNSNQMNAKLPLLNSLTLAFLVLLSPLLPGFATENDRPPNFIIIFIDDLGYADIGPFGSQLNRTPNLDRMAAEGMVLTDFYVACLRMHPIQGGAAYRLLSPTGGYGHQREAGNRQ